jgi:hypothetical protein
MIMSIDWKKHLFYKIQYPIVTLKKSQQSRDRTELSLIEDIPRKPEANMMKTGCFPSLTRSKTGGPFLGPCPLLA